jgi:hypothetical protein
MVQTTDCSSPLSPAHLGGSRPHQFTLHVTLSDFVYSSSTGSKYSKLQNEAPSSNSSPWIPPFSSAATQYHGPTRPASGWYWTPSGVQGAEYTESWLLRLPSYNPAQGGQSQSVDMASALRPTYLTLVKQRGLCWRW